VTFQFSLIQHYNVLYNTKQTATICTNKLLFTMSIRDCDNIVLILLTIKFDEGILEIYANGYKHNLAQFPRGVMRSPSNGGDVQRDGKQQEKTTHHDRWTLGAGMSPNNPKARTYNPDAPIIPSKYPKLDQRPSVMESNDHPITMDAVRTGITDERTPDSRQER